VFRDGAWADSYASFGGTNRNCAGGVSTWGSWLTNEEVRSNTVSSTGRRHGYVFEVPADTSLATDFSADGLIAFDLDLNDAQPVRLDFLLGAADVGGALDLNAVLRNLTGAGIDRLNLTLSIGSFDTIGRVTRPFGGGDNLVDVAGQLASLSFVGTEYLDVHLGNPFAQPGLNDWRIDTRGLNAGDVLAITIAVPEPGAVALVLSALLALVAVRARRGRR
jgi:hypothetical protein